MTLEATLVWASLFLFLAGAIRRVLLWSRGRRAAIRWSAVLSLPGRYFHDVHDVVSQDVYMAVMHMLAAGGFAATLLLTLLVHGLGLQNPIFVWLLLLSAAVAGSGGCMAMWRRYVRRPERVSAGAYDLLPLAIVGFAGFVILTSLATMSGDPIRWLSVSGSVIALLGVLSFGFLVPGMTIGPMRHAFAGVMHLVFHPREKRFDAPGATGLRLIDLEDASLGVGRAYEFSWKQLLSFDACVQCGRCEEVCPAHAAGAPLNPKKLIFDLWAASSGPGNDRGYRGNGHPGLEQQGTRNHTPEVLVHEDGIIHPDTLWACTTCRACVEACPMMIEHVDAVVDLRRHQVLERGLIPGKGGDALIQLREADTVSGKPLSARLSWASDLNLPVATRNQAFEVLLWLGEAVFDQRGQRTIRALVRLLRIAGVDFAILGEAERDIGDVARRLGDEVTFTRLALDNISLLDRFDFERIVTSDPHVLQTLRHEYPALGGRYEVTHHASFVLSLVRNNRLSLGQSRADRITYHDPCYLGRYNGEYEAPRELVRQMGVDLVEMERSRENSFCCGWGGGAAFTDIESEQRIPDLRMAQASCTGAQSVAVACPNCAVMFEGVSGRQADVIDVIELVDLAAEGDS